MKKRLRLKPRIIFIIITLILVVTFTAFFTLNSPQYKLKRIGYSKDEIKLVLNSIEKKDVNHYIDYYKKYDTTINNIILIINNDATEYEFSDDLIAILNDKDYQREHLKEYIDYHSKYDESNIEDVVFLINKDIKHEYSLTLLNITKEKYFIKSNLNRYLEYSSKNIDKNSPDIVREVNSNIDYDFYTNVVNADVENSFLVIVNKYYKTNKSYKPDLVEVNTKYTFNRAEQMEKSAYNAFVEMANVAEKGGIYLGINSAYRSYSEQEKLYNDYAGIYGLNYAEAYAAREGHSEHHTGLAIDIKSKSNPNTSFEYTKEFTWMKENAHKYGFILRYSKEKEYLTGYNYEPWHYRYVGKEAANHIYQNNITFEEYHSFYIENN